MKTSSFTSLGDGLEQKARARVMGEESNKHSCILFSWLVRCCVPVYHSFCLSASERVMSTLSIRGSQLRLPTQSEGEDKRTYTIFSVLIGSHPNVFLARLASMTFCLGAGEPGTPLLALGKFLSNSAFSDLCNTSRRGW